MWFKSIKKKHEYSLNLKLILNPCDVTVIFSKNQNCVTTLIFSENQWFSLKMLGLYIDGLIICHIFCSMLTLADPGGGAPGARPP